MDGLSVKVISLLEFCVYGRGGASSRRAFGMGSQFLCASLGAQVILTPSPAWLESMGGGCRPPPCTLMSPLPACPLPWLVILQRLVLGKPSTHPPPPHSLHPTHLQVFRTYNASIVLDRLLTGEVDSESVEAKKAAYDTANKEVAVLCNHQRAVPKGHVGQMEKLTAKMEALHAELAVRWRDGARGGGRRVVNPGPEGWDA